MYKSLLKSAQKRKNANVTFSALCDTMGLPSKEMGKQARQALIVGARPRARRVRLVNLDN